ncbi:hypothetical protein KP509_09G094100 [Ceratopteris richardii]|nr:hypothetical protein KP509_09G094100 [Ceratopteris richardii]
MDPAINANPSGSLQHFGSPQEMTGLRMAAQGSERHESFQEDSGGREAETLTSYEVLSRANARLEPAAGTESEELETIRRLLDVSDDDLDSPNVRIGEWNDWLNEGYDVHCLPHSLFVDESS